MHSYIYTIHALTFAIIHKYIYSCKHVDAFTNIHPVYMHNQKHTHASTLTIHTLINMCTHTHSHRPTHKHALTLTSINIRVNLQTNTRTHTPTLSHKHV